MAFETRGALKMAELDNWENGCDFRCTLSSFVDYPIAGETLPEIIEKVKSVTGADEVDVNACDETGRIDAQLTENEEGMPASPAELEAWKAGRIDLYAVTYSFMFEAVTRTPAIFNQ